jgi:hypothetical protein
MNISTRQDFPQSGTGDAPRAGFVSSCTLRELPLLLLLPFGACI